MDGNAIREGAHLLAVDDSFQRVEIVVELVADEIQRLVAVVILDLEIFFCRFALRAVQPRQVRGELIRQNGLTTARMTMPIISTVGTSLIMR